MSIRHQNICNSLNALKEAGYISDWYVGSNQGKAWRVWAPGSDRVYSTKEIEAFIVGAKVVIFKELRS